MTIFRKNQVLHIAAKNVWELFFAYILVCWSYENGKNLPALLNLTKSINVVHPNLQDLPTTPPPHIKVLHKAMTDRYH